jgi:hypothetical protein
MLAACGVPDESSHASPGIVDYYILGLNDDGSYKIVISLIDGGGGSDGNPGTVSIQKFGPHLFGFVELAGSVFQGYATQDRSIVLPWKRAFRAIR